MSFTFDSVFVLESCMGLSAVLAGYIIFVLLYTHYMQSYACKPIQS